MSEIKETQELQHIVIFEDCFICGDEFTLYTKADQDEAEGNGWAYVAFDGDTVQCATCGAIGWVSADGDDTGVNYDEESEHNVRCADAYEARRSQDRSKS